jgi:hypothetical protein
MLLFRCSCCFSKVLKKLHVNSWLTTFPAASWYTNVPSVLQTSLVRELLGVPALDVQLLMGAHNFPHFCLDWVKLERQTGDASVRAYFNDFDIDRQMDSLVINAGDASSRVPELQRFRPSATSKPTPQFLTDFWRPLAIDGVALAVCEREAVVQIPLAARVPKQQEHAATLNVGGSDWNHPSFLPGFLAEELLARLQVSTFARQMAEDGFRFLGGMRPHKNDMVQAGDNLYFIHHCGSDRAAYVIDATDGTKTMELLHF